MAEDYDVRLKSNGNYWQAWWVEPPPSNARRVKSLGSKDKLSSRQARAKCRQLALDLSLGRVIVDGGACPRLSEWFEIHKACRASVRASTRELDAVAAQYLGRFFEHDPRINRITKADASDWRAALASGELSLDNADACAAPAESTVCKHVRTVKAMFEVAVARGTISANPFDGLKGNAPDPDQDWLEVTPANMRAILDACPNDGYRALFALSRWAGLRRDEARRLQWGDILFDKNRIMVNAREKNATTKWKRRVCPIEPPRVPTGLTTLLRDWFNSAPAGSVGPCDGVDRHNLYLKAGKVMHAAGVVYAKPFHTLRKCWQTELSMIYPIHVVVAWLGNTFAVALKHYMRVPDDLYGGTQVQIVPNPTTDGQSATNPPPTQPTP